MTPPVSHQSFVSPALRDRVRELATPIATGLGRIGLTPNGLTVVGFLGTAVAAIAAGAGAWLAAGLLVLAFGIFDLFDGALARATGRVSRFGAFLDSTLDRTGENLVYAGIGLGCAVAGFELGVLLAGLAMAASSVVTYARARAESLGVSGDVGVAPRAERLVVLSGGLVLAGLLGGIEGAGPIDAGLDLPAGGLVLAASLGLIASLSAITIIQRIRAVRQQLDHPQPSAGPQENRT